MNFADEDRENRLEELKINIFALQGNIETAEKDHTANEYTLNAWKKELKTLESEMESLIKPPEKEINPNFDT